MFTSDKKLKLRGGSREERLAYMRKLIAEFHSSWLLDVKRQIAANLANFAYDPFNYENLKIVGVVDVFLACLTSKDSELMRISSAGLFNLSSDSSFAKLICDVCIAQLHECLNSQDEEVLISVVSTLLFLQPILSETSIVVHSKIAKISSDPKFSQRLRNVALVYLTST